MIPLSQGIITWWHIFI